MSRNHSLEENLARAESLLPTRVKAAHILSASLVRKARAGGLRREEALALRIHAHALKGLERHEEALECYRRSRRLFLRVKEPVEAARTEIGRVDALMYLDRVPEARRVGRRALRELLALGETLRAGRLLSNLGNIEYRLDRPRVALNLYREARSLLAETGNPLDLAFVDYNLANIRVQLDELDAAEQDYQAAQDAARRHRHALLDLHVEYALAGLDASRGRLTGALKRLAVCEERFAALGHDRGRCNALLDRAEVYRRLHLESDAEHAAAQAQAGFRRLGLRLDEARAMFHRGAAALHGGDLRGGRSLLQQAASRFQRLGNHAQAAAATVRLAQALGSHRTSPRLRIRLIEDLRGARRILARLGFDALEREARIEEARRCGEAGRLGRAVTLLRQAEAGLDERLHPDLAARIAHLRMQLAATRGDRATALGESESMIRHLERVRQHLVDDEFLAAHLWEWRRGYGDWMRLRAAAFARSPGDLYRDLQRLDIRTAGVASRPETRSRTSAGPSSATVDLRRRLAHLTAADRRELPDPDLSPAPRRRREARRLERELSERLRRERMVRSAGSRSRGPVEQSLEDLRGRLRPGELLALTFDEGSRLGFLLVTREGCELPPERIDKRALDDALDDLRFQFDRVHVRADFSERREANLRSASARSLARLAEVCLPAIAGRLTSTQRLLMRPAAGFERVPWGALPLAGAPLWRDRSVVTVADTRGFSTRAERPRRSPGGDRDAIFVAPDSPDLPDAREEVGEASRALGRGEVVAGPEASREGFLRRVGQARLIHFAGHGRFREDNPLYSSLEFSDGPLYFLDLERLSLRADLVVLSACRGGSARPELQLGTGLARGFLQAGARSLLLSQWPVGDVATRRLMGGFYRELASGRPPAEALRLTALSRAREGAHPAAWATFQLVGTSNQALPVV